MSLIFHTLKAIILTELCAYYKGEQKKKRSFSLVALFSMEQINFTNSAETMSTACLARVNM